MTGLFSLQRAAVACFLVLCAMTAAAEHIVLESYQEREGLTNLTPFCLDQAGQGPLWVCTEDGLFRFDGFRMRREPLPREAGAKVVGARVDRAGRVWVGAEGGLFIREQEAAGVRWIAVRKPDGEMLRLGRARQLDWDESGAAYLMDGDHRLWSIAPAPAGATALVAQPLAVPQTSGSPGVLSPLRWRAGALWFGCDEGLCEWRDQRLMSWGPDRGLPAGGWSNLLVARDGSLWARSGRGLAHLSNGASRFDVVDSPAVLSGAFNNFITLAEDREGAIFTNTDNGIARWDGHAWREWTEKDGLPDTAIRTLLFDAEGSLWLGAGGRGVHRWVGYGQVEHWTRADGLPSNVVMSMLRDGSGRLWATTREGVAWFDEVSHRFVPLEVPGPQRVRSWRCAMIAGGDLWWTENDRLLTVKAGSSTVRVVASDPLLVGAYQGDDAFYLLGSNAVERLMPTAAGLRRETFGSALPGGSGATSVASDGKSDWFVTDGRVLRWKDGAWVAMVDPNGVPVPAFGDLSFDGAGTLWLYDGKGARQYEVKDGVAVRLRNFSPEFFGGAPPIYVSSAADGHLWIGTSQGVFIVHRDESTLHLHHGNGLVWNDVDPGFMIDGDGSAWITTSRGVSRVRPSALRQQQAVLRVEQVEFGAQLFQGPPTQPASWADRRMRVTLGTSDYSLARSLRIEYRVGRDTPWRAAEGSVLEIGALEAGVQLLQVRARGLTPAEPVGPVLSMPFEVRPPWWQTPAARAAGAVLLVALWWGSWWMLQRRARTRGRALEQAITERTAELEASREALRRLGEHNARSLEDERKRVARELHDEFGQQLVALRMEMSVAGKRAAAGGGLVVGEYLAPLFARLDTLVLTMRSLVSQLRPPALDGGLLAALRWLASESSQGGRLECTVEAEADLPQLSPDLATMVFRIAQESLNNVRRHAKASHVSLQLTQEGDQWTLTVRDDGAGFDPAHRRHGYGILGMEERARLLGGHLDVDSAPGHGTTVRLRFAT